MNILVVNRHLPYPLAHGRSLIIYNVFKRLSAGHTVLLVAFRRGPEDDEHSKHLEDVFSEIRLVSPPSDERPVLRRIKNALSWSTGFTIGERDPETSDRFRKAIGDIAGACKVDLVHCSGLDMAEFVMDFRDLPRVLHLVDSATLGIRRRLRERSLLRAAFDARELSWYLRMKRYEARMMAAFDATVTVGKKDHAVLKELAPRAEIRLIPNGVDLDYFHVLECKRGGRPTVLFSGNMSFPPNVDAVLYFHDRILPVLRRSRPDLRFIVAGIDPSERIRALAGDGDVIVTGYVDDIRTYFAQADVIVCPMRIGGGIKNKVLEAMAVGRPVVATSIGAEGIEATHGKEIFIADDPAGFADAVMKLLDDESLRAAIAGNARKLVERLYTWEVSTSKYEMLYRDLLCSNPGWRKGRKRSGIPNRTA